MKRTNNHNSLLFFFFFPPFLFFFLKKVPFRNKVPNNSQKHLARHNVVEGKGQGGGKKKEIILIINDRKEKKRKVKNHNHYINKLHCSLTCDNANSYVVNIRFPDVVSLLFACNSNDTIKGKGIEQQVM